jgi:hypothetical protein
MGGIDKGFSLLLVATLAVSSLMIVESASAQSIPKPSVPKFSLQYNDGSYDVPTTQTTDPYTGQIITHQGYHVNLTVFEMVIQNQLNPTNNLYYDVQVKGHYSSQWVSLFDLSEYLPRQDSSSQQTILRIGQLSEDGLSLVGSHKSITIPSGGKEDIRVQALVGSIGRNASAPFAAYTFYGTESDWSNTQTITAPGTSTSTSPTPNPTPTPTVPELPFITLIIVIVALTLAISVFKRLLFNNDISNIGISIA